MTKQDKELIIRCLNDGKTESFIDTAEFEKAIAIAESIRPDDVTTGGDYLAGYGKAMAELASLKAEWFSEGYEEGRSDFSKDET